MMLNVKTPPKTPPKVPQTAESTTDQGLRRLVANVAHDLKTPLSALTNGNELVLSMLNEIKIALLQIPQVSSDLIGDLEFAESTLESTLSMGHFMRMSINRCMEFSQVQEDCKLKPMSGTVNLAEALRLPINCIESVDPNQVIEVLAPPLQLCSHVITDVQWLQENVLCLLSNAVKYSNHDKIVLRLSLLPTKTVYEEYQVTQDVPDSPPSPRSSFTANQMVVLECEDTGIGLSEDSMANLFAPFKQAQRLAGGTGLGLYSLANRMKALRGHCGVRPRRDGSQGCRFWFAFPYKPDELAAEAALEIDASSQGSPTDVSLSMTHDQSDTQLRRSLHCALPATQANERASNIIAPLPVYAKKLSSRSLLSAMSQLPTSSETVTPLSVWRNASSTPDIYPSQNSSSKTLTGEIQCPNASSSFEQDEVQQVGGVSVERRIEPSVPPLRLAPTASSAALGIASSDSPVTVQIASPAVPSTPNTRVSPRVHDSHRKLTVSTATTCTTPTTPGGYITTGHGYVPATPRTSARELTPSSTSRSIAAERDSPLYVPRALDSANTRRNAASGEVLSILLVDDTPLIVRITSGLLQRAGYEVAMAGNGYEALRALQQRDFDMVLMDLQMPVLDGLETLRRIRAAEAKSELKKHQFMVAVSANSDPAIIQDSLDTGFDAFIEKPFGMPQFDRAVQEYMEHSAAANRHTLLM